MTNYSNLRFIISTLFVLIFSIVGSVFSQDLNNNNNENQDCHSIWYIAKIKSDFFKDSCSVSKKYPPVKAGESFLFFPKCNTAYAKINQIDFSISEQHVEKVDSVYFKFVFTKSYVLSQNYEELEECVHRNGINMKTLIKNVFNNKHHAFIKVLNPCQLDGAAATIYGSFFWEILNALSDKELAGYLKKSDEKIKNDFSKLIVTLEDWDANPIVNTKVYFKQAFPLSYSVIKKIFDEVEKNNPKK